MARWSVIVALCGCGSAPVLQTAVGSTSVVAPPIASLPALAAPIVVAVRDGNKIATYAITRDAVTARTTATLPETAVELAWLDRTRIVALADSGQAYLVTNDRVDRYKMPAAKAWRVKAKVGQGEARATFPSRLVVAGDGNGHAEMASCVIYVIGDDDPCQTWAVASLDASLVVGSPVAMTSPPEGASAEPPTLSAPSGFSAAVDAKAPSARLSCTTASGTSHVDWNVGDCLLDVKIAWLSTQPPLLLWRATSNCGEGANDIQHRVLRACKLDDFVNPNDDHRMDVVWWADALWAHADGTSGWSVVSGDRVLGAIATDAAPLQAP